jgi:hypothetical protein
MADFGEVRMLRVVFTSLVIFHHSNQGPTVVDEFYLSRKRWRILKDYFRILVLRAQFSAGGHLVWDTTIFLQSML